MSRSPPSHEDSTPTPFLPSASPEDPPRPPPSRPKPYVPCAGTRNRGAVPGPSRVCPAEGAPTRRREGQEQPTRSGAPPRGLRSSGAETQWDQTCLLPQSRNTTSPHLALVWTCAALRFFRDQKKKKSKTKTNKKITKKPKQKKKKNKKKTQTKQKKISHKIKERNIKTKP